MFAVPDESTVQIVSSKQIGTCPGMPEAAIKGCDAAYDLVVTYEADFYLCTDQNAQATADGCPKSAWQFLQRTTLKNVKIENWQHHFSGKDIVRAGWQSLFGDVAGSILFSFFAEDMMDCLHGSASGCAWAYATYVPVEGALSEISNAVKAADAAARTGVGFTDAWKALRALKLPEDAIVGIFRKLGQRLRGLCLKDSFPAATPVLLADGSVKRIDAVKVGDRLLATDPDAGTTGPEPVTSTFSHSADRLLQISFADGGRILTTPGHRMYVPGRGWVHASSLHRADSLRTPTGALHTVAGIRPVAAPQQVWDLSIADLHTFYVLAGRTPVLVHNVDCPVYFAAYPSGASIVADVDKDGLFGLAIEAVKNEEPRGCEMFNAALAHFGDAVKGIKGYWQDGGSLSDNLNSFNEAVRAGASLEEAALTKTFTGKMAARAGFSKVEITELRGMPGHYTNVGAIFR
ncbi:polymorphic toxin-type HINT domain-containing protein [Streptomyces sp. Ag109_G2-15]|uniref:polymorphic toxin-type HINT domain-containing protein n=1 Tax=Streptomyces sp. Ag109_G2-15 TaxID=1938850 RepID=UPI000BC794F7|nr:polymorphic toxin-type HINT domain-containing protein [Streptomyces sp. Ag109_G2-15]SOD84404.1 Pretoxin HINT domain-containing protein [Streptomyces sp. Ag109_G2-15]